MFNVPDIRPQPKKALEPTATSVLGSSKHTGLDGAILDPEGDLSTALDRLGYTLVTGEKDKQD